MFDLFLKRNHYDYSVQFLKMQTFRNTSFPGKRNDTETSVESFVQEDGDGKQIELKSKFP